MKIVIFSTHFGTLPRFFQLWLNSISNNKDIHIRFFTDNDLSQYKIPNNVYYTKISLKNFVENVQSKFDFKINIQNAYKLCDIKPMYGYLFEEEIKNYDYWGHADIDFIYGDLSNFVLNLSFLKQKKFFRNGHFSIYKNTTEVNRFFKHKIHKIDYQHILSNTNNFSFDELEPYSINRIFDDLNEPVFHDNDLVADVHPLFKSFKLCHLDYPKSQYKKLNDNYLFIYEKGKIFGFYFKNGKILKKEFIYLHIQKRSFLNLIHDHQEYLIVPDKFIAKSTVDIETLKKFSSHNIKFLLFVNAKFKSLNYFITKIKNLIIF